MFCKPFGLFSISFKSKMRCEDFSETTFEYAVAQN
jgi:hypothetical protein